MIILQSQTSEISLNTLTLSLSAKFIETPFISLDILTLSMSLPASPSLGLIHLNTLTLALSPTIIPPCVDMSQDLDTLSMTLIPKNVTHFRKTITSCQTSGLIAGIVGGGSAPATPEPIADDDIADLLKDLRDGTIPGSSYDASDPTSSLIKTLQIGGTLPLLPETGWWCTGSQSPYEVQDRMLIVQNSGYVAASANSGSTWDDTYTFVHTDADQSIYLGYNICLVSAGSTGLFRSTDGGSSWDLVSGGIINIVSFAHNGKGVVIAGGGGRHIWRSTDWGLSWTDLGIIGWTTGWMMSPIFLSEDIAVIFCYDRLYRSVDSGATWDLVSTVSSSVSYILQGISLGGGVALAGVYSTSGGVCKFIRTTDYGLTWSDVVVSTNSNNKAPMALSNIGDGVLICAVYTLNTIYRSSDAGLTWAPVASVGAKDNYPKSFMRGALNRVVWIVNDPYWRSWRAISNDLGLTWSNWNYGSEYSMDTANKAVSTMNIT